MLLSLFIHQTGIYIFFPYVVNRGPATEWYDALYLLLRCSRNVRKWFAQNVLFAHPSRFAEYLLECPSSEVSSFSSYSSSFRFLFFVLFVFFPSKFLMRYLNFKKITLKNTSNSVCNCTVVKVLICDPTPANEALCGKINFELWAKM